MTGVQIGQTMVAVELLRDSMLSVDALAEVIGVSVDGLLDWAEGPGLIYGLDWPELRERQRS